MPPSPLVECVPNFSEGRDPAVIKRISEAIRSVEGVRLLDVHMDEAHHRSVFTFVGPPQAVADAAVAAARPAVEMIDLRRHRGAHPRMGAVDVVPFVPLAGATLRMCAALAQGCGRRIADELGVPVYLYGEAASRPERRNLAEVRRPRFEGLGARMASDPAWAPDFGPPRLHATAGAAAVGARPPLVAFNVYLDTPDAATARAVARAVRERDGGLPGVKALGFFIEGRRQAQVSMNLCDPGRTSMKDAFVAVARAAAARGAKAVSSELVGMISEAFFDPAWPAALKIEGFRERQVIERNL
jgi:glutamate formiminotransferase